MNIGRVNQLPTAPPRKAAWPSETPGPLDSYLQAVEPAYLLANMGKPNVNASGGN